MNNLALTTWCSSDIINTLPTNLNTCTRALFVFFDSNCEQKGQLRPPQLVALVQFKFVGSRQLGCPFLRMKNNDNDAPLVVKVLGTIIAVPVYACMAILILAIPLLFMGSVIGFLSGRAFESLESFIGSLLCLLITGFILREGFKEYAPWFVEQYEKYFKK
jgi:hypothetical protein